MTRVLVTELVSRGYEPVIVDNFVNSSPRAIDRIGQLTNSRVEWYEADVRDTARIAEILSKHECEAAIHFAGLKAVGVEAPAPDEHAMDRAPGELSPVLELGQQIGQLDALLVQCDGLW